MERRVVRNNPVSRLPPAQREEINKELRLIDAVIQNVLRGQSIGAAKHELERAGTRCGDICIAFKGEDGVCADCLLDATDGCRWWHNLSDDITPVQHLQDTKKKIVEAVRKVL